MKMGRLFRKPSIWGIVFSIALTGFSAYTVLEAFVLPSDVVKVSEVSASAGVTKVGSIESEEAGGQAEEGTGKEAGSQAEEGTGEEVGSQAETGTGEEAGNQAETEAGSQAETEAGSQAGASGEQAGTAADENTYIGDGVRITLEEKTVDGTQVYIADIQLDDPGKLLTGLADGSFGRNVSDTTSNIASEVGAVLAINGDYYGFRDSGYVMRNGYLYRTNASGADEDLVIYGDGRFEIINEADVTAEELEANGAVQIFSFGPALVNDGAVSVSEGDEVGQAMRSNPRTAIGQIGEGHYVFVVSDGRTEESEGLTLKQLADVCADLGCTVAYNLDGGGSTAMVFQGKVVNKPTTNGHTIRERSVSDIVYIGE